MAMMNTTANSAADQEQISMPSKYRKTIIAMRRRLQRLNNHLTTDRVQQLDCSALSVHLDSVEQINQTVNCALYDSDAELEDDLCNDFESLYHDVKVKLTRQLNILNKREHPRSSTMRQFSVDQSSFVNSAPTVQKPRLPEIQLPKFSGAYQEWPNFFGLFSTVIHENSDLSDLERFHYLRTCLCDAALDTISSLELSAANYEEAVKLLKCRFENKLLNFQAHVKEIFALKAVEKSSAGALRHLSDKLNSHLRAIKTIATNEQMADGLLLYLVASKLDSATQMKWEESLSSNTLPTWKSMAEFLERRCRMLENVEYSLVSKAHNQHAERRSSAHNRHVHVSTAASSLMCSFCDSSEHSISSCQLFGNLSPSLRYTEAKRLNLCLNCLRKGHMLNRCTAGRCRQCSGKHHTMLHLGNAPVAQPLSSSADEVVPTTPQSVLISSASPPAERSPPTNTVSVLLATAIILVKNQLGVPIPCRAILDSASQLHLITSRFVNRLQLKCDRTYATISGIGDGNRIIDRSVDISVKSQHSDYTASFTAMVVPTITDYQPNVNVDTDDWNIPKNIQLADPSFNQAGRIDLLIGAELFFDLMSVGQIRMADNLPILQKTSFGWVLAGGGLRSLHSSALAVSCPKIKEEEVMLSSILKSFWEIENNFDSSVPYSEDELFCENHFLQHTLRLSSGSYSVRLPQVEGRGASSLGGSYERALQRFKGLEKKFKRYPEIKAPYAAFMREYAELNHMSLISLQTQSAKYFLPHHCVQKLDSTSTKLRVVFDGSAKTTSGLSLNDVLHSGPTIQKKLFNTLLRYRFFKVALCGDICKMYRCVQVSHPDDYLQCILWRENEEEELKTFKLNTVTYGTKPAAFLAIRAMHQLAADEEDRYPLGAKIVRRDFYVDDMISGGDSIDEVLTIRQEVAVLLQRGGFVIRKWCSNMPEVLDGVPSADVEQFLKFHDGTDVTKTLGLIWDPKTDNFIFSFNPADDWKVVTKRTILSSIARLYDPLGLIGPIITKAKIFMQHLWKAKLQWDESLPQSLHSSWLDYIAKFSSVHRFVFPRYVSMPQANIQIHAFCDASLAAYGACIYIRSEVGDVIKTSLLCSKSRVSPLKSLTVPKLELSAALLLAELLDVVIKELPLRLEIHCWSDSMVVLSWIREQPSNFNIFVSNRVARIQTLTNKTAWHYVPTELNPADILSRGATPEELLHSPIWKNGPQFLRNGPSSWPSNLNFLAELPERRKNILVMASTTDLAVQCKYHNSFTKMQRIFGYVSKFVTFKSRESGKDLTPNDIKHGTHLLIKNIQLVNFSAEYKALKQNQNISSSSKLLSLMPIMDTFGLIRVGGRLQHSSLDFDARHPIILPQRHPFTSSLVVHFHEKLLHAGSQSLTASIRQQYWPIGGRKLAIGRDTTESIPIYMNDSISVTHPENPTSRRKAIPRSVTMILSPEKEKDCLIEIDNVESFVSSKANVTLNSSCIMDITGNTELPNILANINNKASEFQEKLHKVTYLQQSDETILKSSILAKENETELDARAEKLQTVDFNHTIERSPVKIKDCMSRFINLNEYIEQVSPVKTILPKEHVSNTQSPKLVLRKMFTPISKNCKKTNHSEIRSTHPYHKINQNEYNAADIISATILGDPPSTAVHKNSPSFTFSESKKLSLSPDSFSHLLPTEYKKLNFKQLNDEIERGKIQLFPKTPTTDRKSKENINFTRKFSELPKERQTLFFEDDISMSPDNTSKNMSKPLDSDDYFDFNVTSDNLKQKKLVKTKCRFSQADDLMLDNTSFLTIAKLGDETTSRNSTKRDLTQLNGYDIFVETLSDAQFQVGGEIAKLTEGNNTTVFNHAICSKKDSFKQMKVCGVDTTAHISSKKLQTNPIKKHGYEKHKLHIENADNCMGRDLLKRLRKVQTDKWCTHQNDDLDLDENVGIIDGQNISTTDESFCYINNENDMSRNKENNYKALINLDVENNLKLGSQRKTIFFENYAIEEDFLPVACDDTRFRVDVGAKSFNDNQTHNVSAVTLNESLETSPIKKRVLRNTLHSRNSNIEYYKHCGESPKANADANTIIRGSDGEAKNPFTKTFHFHNDIIVTANSSNSHSLGFDIKDSSHCEALKTELQQCMSYFQDNENMKTLVCQKKIQSTSDWNATMPLISQTLLSPNLCTNLLTETDPKRQQQSGKMSVAITKLPKNTMHNFNANMDCVTSTEENISLSNIYSPNKDINKPIHKFNVNDNCMISDCADTSLESQNLRKTILLHYDMDIDEAIQTPIETLLLPSKKNGSNDTTVTGYSQDFCESVIYRLSPESKPTRRTLHFNEEIAETQYCEYYPGEKSENKVNPQFNHIPSLMRKTLYFNDKMENEKTENNAGSTEKHCYDDNKKYNDIPERSIGNEDEATSYMETERNENCASPINNPQRMALFFNETEQQTHIRCENYLLRKYNFAELEQTNSDHITEDKATFDVPIKGNTSRKILLKNMLEKSYKGTTPRKGLDNKAFLKLITPRKSLDEFLEYEKWTEKEGLQSADLKGSQCRSLENIEISMKRLPANLTPLASMPKKRHSSKIETNVTARVVIDEFHKSKTKCGVTCTNIGAENSLPLVADDTLMHTTPKLRMSQIALPLSIGKRIDSHEVVEPSVSNFIGEDGENVMESIQEIRKATALRRSETLFDHNKPMQSAELPGTIQQSAFEDQPITISDVSVYFHDQRKGMADIYDMPNIPPIEEINCKSFHKRYMNLTCDSPLEEIDQTCISLVRTLSDEDEDESTVRLEKNGCDVLCYELPETCSEIETQSPFRNIDMRNDELTSNHTAKQVHNVSPMCRKCKRYQLTFINESTSNTTNSFLLPLLPPTPTLDMNHLRQLRARPHLSDVNVLWQRSSLNRTIINLSNTSDEGNMSFVDNTYIDCPGVTNIIREYTSDIQRLKSSFLESKQIQSRFDRSSLVCHLIDSLRHSNWLLDFQMQYSGMLVFVHRKLITFSLVINYEEGDALGMALQLKSVKHDSIHVPQKNWAPVDFILDFQFKLNSPYDLLNLCGNYTQFGISTMIHQIDQICMETILMGVQLQRIVFHHGSSIIRDENRTFVRKIVRKIMQTPGRIKRVEMVEFRIELLNIKKLCFKDITMPALYRFSEDIHLLPIGLAFLTKFLHNPMAYLNTA